MNTTQFLLSLLCRSLGLGLLGYLSFRIAHRAPASARHRLALGTLLAMLLLPVALVVPPSYSVSLPNAPEVVVYLSGSPVSPRPVSAASRVELPAGSKLPSTSPSWLAIIWITGSVLVCLRLGAGLTQLVMRRRKAIRIDVPGFNVPVIEDRLAQVPMTAWLGRSVIFLPPVWRTWTSDRLARVLAHEAAHVRRGDWFAQMAMNLAVAVHWPNPFAWLLLRDATYVAECAADAAVLSAGAEPAHYAGDLLDIARSARTMRSAVAVPMAVKADVSRRIEMILIHSQKQRGFGRLGLIGLSAMLVIAAVPLTTWALQAKGPAMQPALAAPSDSVAVLVSAQLLEPGAGNKPMFQHKNFVTKGADCKDCHRTIAGQSGLVASTSSGFAMIVPEAAADKILNEAKLAGTNLVSSPKVKTLSGMQAMVTTSDGDLKRTLKVTPMVTQTGAIMLSASISTTRGDKVEMQVMTDGIIPPGNALILFARNAKGQLQAMCILRASKV